MLGVNPEQFRSWTPLATASDQRLWTALQRGHFVTSDTLARQLHLHPGDRYRLGSAGQQHLILGGSAPLGVAGIGALVSSKYSAGLGLIPGVLALISAPGVSMAALTRAVRHIAGKPAQLISLRGQQLPVDSAASGSRPASYPQLFKDSAAQFCPGMSWTVLAAIGQIESGDRSNPGVSSAGALGPMQFLPSTWAEWGIDRVRPDRAAGHHEPVRRGPVGGPAAVRGRGGHARRACAARSSPTTTPPGTSTRCSRWPRSTPDDYGVSAGSRPAQREPPARLV